MYRYEPKIPKRKWYKDVLTVLAIAASLFLLLILRAAVLSFITDTALRSVTDVLTLLIAGAASYAVFTRYGTRYAYILEDDTLTLQATRGHRMVRQTSLKIKDITLAEESGARPIRYCYGGSNPTLLRCGEALYAICPDQRLLDAILNKHNENGIN